VETVRLKRFILLAVAMLALVLAAGAAAQESEVVNVRTSVTIRELTTDGASGTLSAQEKDCEPKRTVLLYAVRGAHKEPDIVGKDKTNEKGSWEIRKSLNADTTYYVIANGDRRGEFNCRDDRSSNRSIR
jgi:hypothetical protein